MTTFPSWLQDRAVAEGISPATMRDDDLTATAVILREHADEVVARCHSDENIAVGERLYALADRIDAYADLD